ncbi:sensor domain-containing diguanylate cyclase [Halobacillus litoralis]|uniref:Diguanylate cyclase n=1 Tax=Halobacillus litoralis TaxID=45668 RepID=A0A410MG76_9BACI|nr:sensor domain-containing diguanylate cyclase [Halobacillus litoralis]QAS53722.1 hypothetical protein HLI_16685 [Halobacillus litoralis]
MERVRDLFDIGMMSDLSDRNPYEQLLHMLMDGISDYIFFMEVVDRRRFKYVYMNHAAQAHSPIEGAEWNGKYIEDLLGHEESRDLIDSYEKVVAKKEALTFEDEITINGTLFRGHTVLTPTINEEGKVTHIVAITRNITEVVKKERDLARINAIYRSLMKNTTDAILIVDTDGNVLEANQALEELYGFTKKELQSSTFPFVPDESREEAEGLIGKGLKGFEISGYETVRVHKDGSFIDISVTVSQIQNGEGETIGISAIVRDITEEKRATRRLEASRSRYRSLFKHNPQSILRLTFQGEITKANRASVRLLGKEEDQLLHTSILDWVSDRQAGEVKQQLLNTFFKKDIWFQTSFFVEGEERLLYVFLVPIIDKDQKEGIYAILEDVTEKEKAHEALRQSEEKFRLIADHSNDMISVFAPSGSMMYASPSHKKFFGRDPMAMSPRELRRQLDKEDVIQLNAAFNNSYASQNSFTVSVKLTSQNGEPVWFECRGTPVVSEQGIVSHFVIVARDISNQKTYEEKLERFAFYDYLTDLPNRRLFEDRLVHAIAQSDRTKQTFALLYLDGDGFKSINDQYGHEIGDDFLCLVGKRMKECIRVGDSVGRIGGDEFAILLENIEDSEQAREVAGRALEKLRKPYYVNGQEIASSFSVGVACFPADGRSLDDLFRSADQALYQGKKHGKDQVLLFEDIQ